MSKETNLALTVLPIFAGLRPVPGRVQPALEHTVSELTAIASAAPAAAILRAHLPGVVEPPGVTAAGLFSRVSERTVGPIVAAAAGAAAYLELVHAEVVGGVRVGVIRVVVSIVVVGQELLQERLIGSGGGEARGVGVIHLGFLARKAAAEELSWWDVNVLECFLGGDELVGGVKLVLLSTSAVHIWCANKYVLIIPQEQERE